MGICAVMQTATPPLKRAYSRRAVMVSQYPLGVHVQDLSGALTYEPGSAARKQLLTSQLVALSQTRIKTGETHWVVRQDSDIFDYQPAKVAEAELGPWENKTILPPEHFDTLADAFMNGLENDARLREFILAAAKLAPAMQIAPSTMHDVIQRAEYAQLPRYFMRHDLWDQDCLVWIERSNNQLPKKKLVELNLDEIACDHLGGGWYAFRAIEDAMALKLATNGTEVYPLN